MAQVLMFYPNLGRNAFCRSCFDSACSGPQKPCSCTLRKRFLDRWVCIPCHNTKWDRLHEIQQERWWNGPICQCGTKIAREDDHELTCIWCEGLIDKSQDDPDIGATEEEYYVDNDDDDKNAGPAPPANLPVETLAHVDNKDGTLSVYHQGTRFSGERLSRSMIVGWAQKKGVELPCTCCKCPTQLCDHHRHEMEGDSETSDDEMDEDGEMSDYEDGEDYNEDDIMIDFDDGTEPEVFDGDNSDDSDDNECKGVEHCK